MLTWQTQPVGSSQWGTPASSQSMLNNLMSSIPLHLQTVFPYISSSISCASGSDNLRLQKQHNTQRTYLLSILPLDSRAHVHLSWHAASQHVFQMLKNILLRHWSLHNLWLNLQVMFFLSLKKNGNLSARKSFI